MATKLCCIADNESQAGSPELPNVRITEVTPVKQPLLQKRTPSQASHFTSARTDDLHELRQIFDNAKDDETGRVAPPKAGRARIARPSVYSLHSLHKMKSMHSIIRRKFSRDLSKRSSGSTIRPRIVQKNVAPPQADTVLKQSKDGPNVQLKIIKDNLRKDLLSDKKPDEGGYDSDAREFDDFAKNIAKRTPNKRPSIHSIEWTPSTRSKPTPGSSSNSRHSDQVRDIEPYQIKRPQAATLSARFSQVFSTPNLQAEYSKGRDRHLRRSHSATSLNLPTLSPLSPLRLPSLKTHDQEGVPWSVALNESLRLSQFPVLPREDTSKRPSPSLEVHLGSLESTPKSLSRGDDPSTESAKNESKVSQTPATVVEIRVQEPTSTTTPRTSASIRGSVRENKRPVLQNTRKDEEYEADDDNPRRSVHLYSMRISHHLRSGSLLSWDNLADAPDLPTPPRAFRDRSISDLSRLSQTHRKLSRHERQTSSSGFASSKVPSKWGRVVPNDFREDKSSIYSSRPHSPPDSLGGSLINLSQAATRQDAAKNASEDLTTLRRSNSYPTDNDETPRPVPRHGLTNLRDVTCSSSIDQPSNESAPLARNNSVASTKKSKFREEFSPSPPKKRLSPSASIMRFFNPKRSSVRSQSEVILKPDVPTAVDGSLEIPQAATRHERRLSKSLMSLESEREAMGKEANANPIWDKALKSYQDERAAMFLPQNKNLAVHSSPIRERRASVSNPEAKEEDAPARKLSTKRYSAPLLSPVTSGDLPSSCTRRAALISTGTDDIDPGKKTQMRFDQQIDTASTVGAWGRYPSHTRDERTSSAGHGDHVETRDFALEAAIKFAMGNNSDMADDEIDPTARPVTPPLLPGQKKRKKRVGNTRIAKSHSMTFGKTFLKNYARIFRSQSIEFQKHGHGHRNSIAAGGMLEYPELELIPDVWSGVSSGSKVESAGNDNKVDRAAHKEYAPGDRKGKGKLQDEDSTSTLRPLNSLPCFNEPMATLDGQSDQNHARDTARVWSAYYENFLPAFPRASTELDFDLGGFGAQVRHSFDSKRATMPSHHTIPSRSAKHSRNASRVSRISIVSNGSARPSFVSLGEDENERGTGARSSVSVRRSTMDLITMYKEQEAAEREKVLKLVRVESKREQGGLLGL